MCVFVLVNVCACVFVFGNVQRMYLCVCDCVRVHVCASVSWLFFVCQHAYFFCLPACLFHTSTPCKSAAKYAGQENSRQIALKSAYERLTLASFL